MQPRITPPEPALTTRYYGTVRIDPRRVNRELGSVVEESSRHCALIQLADLLAGMTRFGLSAFGAITIFGLVVAGTMWLIGRWHRRNCVQHRDEVEGDRAEQQEGHGLDEDAEEPLERAQDGPVEHDRALA